MQLRVACSNDYVVGRKIHAAGTAIIPHMTKMEFVQAIFMYD